MLIEKVYLNNSELLYLQIYKIMERKITNNEIPIGKKIQPEKDLCKMFGVDFRTVGKALNKLVDEGYLIRRPSLGTFVVSTEPTKGIDLTIKNEIAVVYCPDVEKPIDIAYSNNNAISSRRYYQSIIDGIESKSSEKGMYLLYNIVKGDGLYIANKRKDIAGLIVLGGITPEILKMVKRAQIPFVLIGDVHQDEKVASVDVIGEDDFDSTYIATRYLIELGHKKILYINKFLEKYWWYKQQTDGYESALKEAGIPCDKSLEIEAKEMSADDRYLLIKDILGKGAQAPFTAMVGVGDASCIAAMKAIKEKNLRIPEDINIVLLGESSEITSATSVSSNLQNLGKKAVERLLERLTNPGSWKPGRVLVPNELHVGNTTAQIKS